VRPARFGPIGLALAPEPRARTLSDELKEAGVSSLDSARDQVGWFDVQGVSRSLQAAAEGEGGVVGAGARVVADRMAAVRDAVLVARPGPDGVDATLSLDFRRRTRSSSGRDPGER
jgi:hypothetical protein